jgi:uncharacterized protein YegJ (DUF2314 family)
MMQMTQLTQKFLCRAGRRFAIVAMAVSAACIAGCDRSGGGYDETTTAKAQQASAWHAVGETDSIVAIDDEAARTELEAAIAKARQTMEDARLRFNAEAPEHRSHWLINWAAEIVPNDDAAGSQAVEHVWVMPINWSPFRIEGVLVSQPVRELACGKTRDELVSFPIEELADWRCTSPDVQTGDAQGGFTIAALKSRYGSVP